MDLERAETIRDTRPRLMQESEVPEHLLGKSFVVGERVMIIQATYAAGKPREGTVTKKSGPNEYVIRFDDGEVETLSR